MKRVSDFIQEGLLLSHLVVLHFDKGFKDGTAIYNIVLKGNKGRNGDGSSGYE